MAGYSQIVRLTLSKFVFVDLNTVQIDEVEEKFVSLINNQKSSFENKIEAIDFEKKELEEKINKLETNKQKVPCHVQGNFI